MCIACIYTFMYVYTYISNIHIYEHRHNILCAKIKNYHYSSVDKNDINFPAFLKFSVLNCY